MTKKFFGTLIVITVLATSAAFAPVAAFWPFDNGGQVQGVQTSTTSGGFFGLIHRVFPYFGGTTGTTTSTGAPMGATGGGFITGPSGSAGAVGLMIPQERINQAVVAGKITQAQGTELLNQLTAIRNKEQELMNLQTALRNWFKANNITTAVFSSGPRPTTSPPGGGYRYSSGATGQMPTTGGNYHPTGY